VEILDNEPEGDLDRRFAVGGNGAAVVSVPGHMDDPEADLRYAQNPGKIA